MIKFFFNLFKKKEKTKEEKNWLIKYGNFNKTNFKGEGEKVAVLDTGVDHEHKEITGKVEALSFIQGLDDPFDYADHGTFIIGEIISDSMGIAPRSKCISAKVLHGDGRDKDYKKLEKNIANAIKYAIDNECGVISMSLGIPYESNLIYDHLNKAVKNGIIPVAASGNEGVSITKFKSYPASFDNCISVASANKYGLPSFFSTSGKGKNKLEQPEVSIASLKYHYGILTKNRYGEMTGTSIACPIVAGLALLWREKNKGKFCKKNNLNEFRKWLKENAQDTNKNGWDNELGYGVLILKPWESL